MTLKIPRDAAIRILIKNEIKITRRDSSEARRPKSGCEAFGAGGGGMKRVENCGKRENRGWKKGGSSTVVWNARQRAPPFESRHTFFLLQNHFFIYINRLKDLVNIKNCTIIYTKNFESLKSLKPLQKKCRLHIKSIKKLYGRNNSDIARDLRRLARKFAEFHEINLLIAEP